MNPPLNPPEAENPPPPNPPEAKQEGAMNSEQPPNPAAEETPPPETAMAATSTMPDNAAEQQKPKPRHFVADACPQCHYDRRGLAYKIEDITEGYKDHLRPGWGAFRCECGCEFIMGHEMEWEVLKNGRFYKGEQPEPSTPSKMASQAQEQRVARDFPRSKQELPGAMMARLMREQMDLVLEVCGHVKTPKIMQWEADLDKFRRMVDGGD
jgi:hypothetical protein